MVGSMMEQCQPQGGPTGPDVTGGDARRRMRAFIEAQAIVASLPRGTDLDDMGWDDIRAELEGRGF